MKHEAASLLCLKPRYERKIKKFSTFTILVTIPGVTVKVPTDLKDRAKILLELRVRDVHYRSDEKERNKTIETREKQTDYVMKLETEVFSNKYKVTLNLNDLEMYLLD